MNSKSIVCISTNDIVGGASIACHRLYQGFKSINQECKLLVQYKSSNDPDIIIAPSKKLYPANWFGQNIDSFIFSNYIELNRSLLTNTYFSFSYPGLSIYDLPILKNADVINLHWIENFLSPLSIAQLGLLKKPIVWTLHDQKPFTGGCHYDAGCQGFINIFCLNCPQLNLDPYGLPNAVLKDKFNLFKSLNLTIVTPSQWLAKEAKKSILFKNLRVEVIPYSIDTPLYRPKNKDIAKKSLNIDPSVTTLLFGAVNSKEERKGFKYLLEAIDYATKNPLMSRKIEEKKICIICMGEPDESISKFHIPIINTNYLFNDEQIVNIYNASDIFILPSTEDNLPNGIMEAMACGTPVIAFNIGGVPDLVNKETGILVEPRNITELAESIVTLILNQDMRMKFGDASRKLIETKYNLSTQALSYITLFDDIINHNYLKRNDNITDEPSYNKNGIDLMSNISNIFNKLVWFSLNKRFEKKYPFALFRYGFVSLYLLLVIIYKKVPRKYSNFLANLIKV
ncbi:MAG: glycosyltransferase [Bacteroidia bacterium]|nr:glycosyltransferase [Bacteroidia bacterium]